MNLAVAVAIPAFEAGATIAPVVEATRRQFDQVLVVDDGSRDGTGRAARDAGARVVRHARNLGKGRALKTAFDDLFGRGYDAVVTLDADGQHLAEEIPLLLEAAPGHPAGDLIIGSRDHLFARMHPLRRTSNRWSSWAISRIAGRVLPDVQSGFRLYTRGLFEGVGFPEARFEAESAVVVRAVRRGFHVVCVPVAMGPVDGRSTSHYRPLRDSLRIASAVTRARMERSC